MGHRKTQRRPESYGASGKTNRFRSDSNTLLKGLRKTQEQGDKHIFIFIINFANTAFGFPVAFPIFYVKQTLQLSMVSFRGQPTGICHRKTPLTLVHTYDISISINISISTSKRSVNRCDISISISTRKREIFLFLCLCFAIANVNRPT